MVGLNVDACIETLKSGECVSENSLKLLCQYVSELLMEESNVQPVLSPVTIVGDLHGQFFEIGHRLFFTERTSTSRNNNRQEKGNPGKTCTTVIQFQMW